MTLSSLAKAEQLIRETGDRATSSRIRVFGFLLSQHSAVTHYQIEMGLNDSESSENSQNSEKIDRVTLYRVLDWLIEKGLAHKVISDDRVWRFRVNDKDTQRHQHHHAHFKCSECTRVICLEDVHVDIGSVVLPAGFHRMETELTVKGVCADCAK